MKLCFDWIARKLDSQGFIECVQVVYEHSLWVKEEKVWKAQHLLSFMLC